MPAEGPKYDFAQVTAPGTEPKIHSIFDFTAEALEQLAFWLEQRGLHIPVSQLLGFSQFTASSATPILTPTESTVSAAYANLTTSGPTITGLADGQYVIFFGANCWMNAAGTDGYMSVKVNSTEAIDNDAILFNNVDAAAQTRAITKTLSGGGNNTLLARYKTTGTANYRYRWMTAIRYGN